MPTKACSRCGEVKPLEAFKKAKNRVNGVSSWCKACHNRSSQALSTRYKAYGPTKHVDEKTCSQCQQVLPVDAFYMNRLAADWRESACKPCKLALNAATYAANPRKHRALVQRWEKQNRDKVRGYVKQRRAKRKNASVSDLTEQEWLTLLAANGNACAFCGSGDDLTQDHAVPLSRGGEHTLTNIIPACRSCNSRKRTRTALEFLLHRMAA